MDSRLRLMFPTYMTRRLTWVALVAILVAPSCGSDEDTSSVAPTATVADSITTGSDTTNPDTTEPDAADSDEPSEWFPNVLAVESEQADDGSWTFSVTLSSPYDSPEQYADAWRVLGPEGDELGFRGLTHDHANEQPFTRSQNGIVIPEGVDDVTVQARDLINGWGGETLGHELAR